MTITTFIAIWSIIGYITFYALFMIANGKNSKFPWYGYGLSIFIGPLFLPILLQYVFEKKLYKNSSKE